MLKILNKKIIIAPYCQLGLIHDNPPSITKAQQQFLKTIQQIDQKFAILSAMTAPRISYINESQLNECITSTFGSLQKMQSQADRLFANDFFVLYFVYICSCFILGNRSQQILTRYENLIKVLSQDIQDKKLTQLNERQFAIAILFLNQATNATISFWEQENIPSSIMNRWIIILLAYKELWDQLKEQPEKYHIEIIQYINMAIEVSANINNSIFSRKKTFLTNAIDVSNIQGLLAWIDDFVRDSLLVVTDNVIDLPLTANSIPSIPILRGTPAQLFPEKRSIPGMDLNIKKATYTLFLNALSYLIGRALENQTDNPIETEALLNSSFSFFLSKSKYRKIIFYRAIAFWASEKAQHNTLVFWLKKYQDQYSSDFSAEKGINQVISNTDLYRKMQLQSLIAEKSIHHDSLSSAYKALERLSANTYHSMHNFIKNDIPSIDLLDNLVILLLFFQQFPEHMPSVNSQTLLHISLLLWAISSERNFDKLNPIFPQLDDFRENAFDTNFYNYYYLTATTPGLDVDIDKNVTDYKTLIMALRLQLIDSLLLALEQIPFKGNTACDLTKENNPYDILFYRLAFELSIVHEGNFQRGSSHLDNLISKYEDNKPILYGLLKISIIILDMLKQKESDHPGKIKELTNRLKVVNADLFNRDYQMRVTALCCNFEPESVPTLCSLIIESRQKGAFPDHTFWLIEPEKYDDRVTALWARAIFQPKLYCVAILDTIDYYITNKQGNSLANLLTNILISTHLIIGDENNNNNLISRRDAQITDLKNLLANNPQALKDLTPTQSVLQAITTDSDTQHAYTLLELALSAHQKSPHIIILLAAIHPSGIAIDNPTPFFLDRVFYPTSSQGVKANDIRALASLLTVAINRANQEESTPWDRFLAQALIAIVKIYTEKDTNQTKKAIKKKKKKKKRRQPAPPQASLMHLKEIASNSRLTLANKNIPLMIQDMKTGPGQFSFSGNNGIIKHLRDACIWEAFGIMQQRWPLIHFDFFKTQELCFLPKTISQEKLAAETNNIINIYDDFFAFLNKFPFKVFLKDALQELQQNLHSNQQIFLTRIDNESSNIKDFLLDQLHLYSVLSMPVIEGIFWDIDATYPYSLSDPVAIFTTAETAKIAAMLTMSKSTTTDNIVFSEKALKRALHTARININETKLSSLFAMMVKEGYLFPVPNSDVKNPIYHVTNKTDTLFGTMAQFEYSKLLCSFKTSITDLLNKINLHTKQIETMIEILTELLFDSIATEQEIEDNITASITTDSN